MYVSEKAMIRYLLNSSNTRVILHMRFPENKVGVRMQLALVPQVDQQVVCHQLGAACKESGTRQMDGWAASGGSSWQG